MPSNNAYTTLLTPQKQTNPGSDAPVVNGDTVHKRKMLVIRQENQIVDSRYGCDLSV